MRRAKPQHSQLEIELGPNEVVAHLDAWTRSRVSNLGEKPLRELKEHFAVFLACLVQPVVDLGELRESIVPTTGFETHPVPNFLPVELQAVAALAAVALPNCKNATVLFIAIAPAGKRCNEQML